MGLIQAISKLLKKKQKKKRSKEKKPKVTKVPKNESEAILKSLKEWELTVKRLQSHPFSQVKIINTSLLESLTEVLRSMDSKLNNVDSKLDNLEKLDEILEILRQSQIELKEKGIKSEKLDSAIEKLSQFTIKDKKALQILKDKGPMTAEEFSKAAKVSRSTASFRLNRLFEKGIVEKFSDGKRILFKFKSEENFIKEQIKETQHERN